MSTKAGKVSKLEAELGIEVYASRMRGIGGSIRYYPEDFIVEEILINGLKASIRPLIKLNRSLNRGRYLVCVLIKKKWDTLAAVNQIAKQIDMDPERISIAGMKDTKALTAQHISIGGIAPQRLQNIRLKNLVIIPVRFSSEPISSRILFGNHFSIIVRSIDYNVVTVRKRIKKIKAELDDLGGVPNFFGHQRFGTVRPITHHVGRQIVKGNFEMAARIFLEEFSLLEHPEAREARKYLQKTHDFKSALKLFPRKLIYERLMLRHLSKYPNDYQGAIRRVPLKLRILFVQSYQSYLFNRFLSERIKQGININKTQVGDYTVRLNKNGLPTSRIEKTRDSNLSYINEEISQANKALTLPLVGFRQLTSDGIQGQIEKEILKEEEVKSEDFHVQMMPEACAPGGLRPALAPIINLSIDSEEESTTNERLIVNFSFALHKSSYATILLREFMKPKDLIVAGF